MSVNSVHHVSHTRGEVTVCHCLWAAQHGCKDIGFDLCSRSQQSFSCMYIQCYTAIQRPLEDLRLQNGETEAANTVHHTLSPADHIASRRRSSSGCCIAAHLRLVHKAMGEEGFVTGIDSSWLKPEKECSPGFELGRWSFLSCCLPPDQCLQRSLYSISTCSQRTCTYSASLTLFLYQSASYSSTDVTLH